MLKQLDAAGLSHVLGDADLPDVASPRRHLPLQGEVVWNLQEEETFVNDGGEARADAGESSFCCSSRSAPVSRFYFDALKQKQLLGLDRRE